MGEELYPWIEDEERRKELVFSDGLEYWYVDNGAISPTFTPSAYERMDIERAKQVSEELDEAIGYIS